MMNSSNKRHSRWLAAIAAGFYAWLAVTAILSAQPPQPAKAPGAEAAPDKWTLILRYGAGSPNDAGPMGHCTATFRSDGHVRIESRRRQGDAGLKNIVIYENDALSPETVEALARAADKALKEPPTRRLNPEDGAFFRLIREGATTSRVSHNNLLEFWNAPPAMLKFVAVMNELLPPKERVPLAPEPDDKQPPSKTGSLKNKP